VDVVVRGRIDLLARRAGRWVVVDFKYATPSERSVAGYAAQLATYRLAVARGWGGPVEGELRFVRGGATTRALPPCDLDDEAAQIAGAGRALGDALRGGTAGEFPKKPDGAAACTALGCGFVRRCWGAGAVTRRAADPPSDSVAS
jgi:hypothetical protein